LRQEDIVSEENPFMEVMQQIRQAQKVAAAREGQQAAGEKARTRLPGADAAGEHVSNSGFDPYGSEKAED
jgi:hypothetical protein